MEQFSLLSVLIWAFNFRLYYTRVKLGNPAKEYNVQIDTGSDVLWVTCNPCDGCPTSNGLDVSLLEFQLWLSSACYFDFPDMFAYSLVISLFSIYHLSHRILRL